MEVATIEGVMSNIPISSLAYQPNEIYRFFGTVAEGTYKTINPGNKRLKLFYVSMVETDAGNGLSFATDNVYDGDKVLFRAYLNDPYENSFPDTPRVFETGETICFYQEGPGKIILTLVYTFI